MKASPNAPGRDERRRPDRSFGRRTRPARAREAVAEPATPDLHSSSVGPARAAESVLAVRQQVLALVTSERLRNRSVSPTVGACNTAATRFLIAVSEQPVVLTDRVVTLRAWEPEDAQAVFAACQDPEIPRFLPIPQPYTEESARAFVSIRRADWDGKDERSFAITDARTGVVLGSIARHRRAEHRAEFGYWLAPEARGKGIATRALRLIADWSFAGGLIRLEPFTHPDNNASGRVAERAGFAREGVRRAWSLDRDGNPEDAVFYVLVRDDRPG